MENMFGKEKECLSLISLTSSAERRYVEKKLKPQGMDCDEYLRLVRCALTEQDVQEKRFSYNLTYGEQMGDLEVEL